MKVIKQQHYPDIEIDDTEKDIIQLWQRGKEDINVIQIERENLAALQELSGKGEEGNLELRNSISFDELITHGLSNGANVVNGMPWSWKINGKSITHENDNVYIIETVKGIERFERYSGYRLSAFEDGLHLWSSQTNETHAPGGCPM